MVALWFRLGCLALFLAVAMGAFGAHALKNILSDSAKAIFETGVRYQMVHGLALLAVSWATSRQPSALITAAGICFSIGILVFSGSLYILSLTGIRAWGAITPIGGLGFLAGWICLLITRF